MSKESDSVHPLSSIHMSQATENSIIEKMKRNAQRLLCLLHNPQLNYRNWHIAVIEATDKISASRKGAWGHPNNYKGKKVNTSFK